MWGPVEIFLIILPLQLVNAGCENKQSCGECITEPSCSWCKDPPLFSGSRCYSSGLDLTGSYCSRPEVVQNKVTVNQNASLNLADVPPSEFVQLQPQNVRLSLLPGRPVNITVRAAHAKDYPVDLYFLMDLSCSMQRSQKSLAQLGDRIIRAIKAKSSSVTTGFGSFVEKNVQPFTSAVPEFNCGCNPGCKPYSFFHQQRLENISADVFSQAVLSAPLAGNVDDPEGSLDALMQAMVCTKEIGWRQNARRMIVLASDKDFHFALDGKLAGIFTPNDGQCHLRISDGYYTHDQELDYPSVSHINSIAQSRGFILIFAVDQEYRNLYEALSTRITGSFVDTLSADGSNIDQIVEDAFNEMQANVAISADNFGPDISVKIYSSCDQQGQPTTRSRCEGVRLGTAVEFTVEVMAATCLNSSRTAAINLLGFNESLVLTVETRCQCPCESESSPAQSPECSLAGKLVCGECMCSDDRSGLACQCQGNTEGLAQETCRQEPEGALCSGRGSCECGVCTCALDPRGKVYGQLCQCDDWTCPRGNNDELCSGHGKCSCGQCQCSEGWRGEACDCTTDTASCVSRYNGEVCSGQGECSCGICICTRGPQGGVLFTGQHCEKGPNKADPCAVSQACVECQHFQTGPRSDSCDRCILPSGTREVSDLRDEELEFTTICSAENQNGCTFSFSIQEPESGIVSVNLLTKQGAKEECVNLAAPLGIGAGALVLLIGILSILSFKCYIMISDKKASAEFKKAVALSKNAVNQMPNEMYKSPISKFENPMYGKAV